MKKYLYIIRGFLMESMSFRFHFIFSALGNLFYIVLIFFLWKAIYNSSGGEINGMTFNDTFVYLALATSLFGLFQTWTEWDMSRSVQNGMVVMEFIKPMDYQIYKLSTVVGFVISNFVSISLPGLILVIFVFNANITIGLNLLVFCIAIILAFLISFTLDFIIGLISFYTESIWGISTTKEVIVLLLSGAVIPLQFFPEKLRNVVEMLPFQAIYHIPLKILIDDSLGGAQYITLVLNQVGWLIVIVFISRVFLKVASRVITVNGG